MCNKYVDAEDGVDGGWMRDLVEKQPYTVTSPSIPNPNTIQVWYLGGMLEFWIGISVFGFLHLVLVAYHLASTLR